MLLLSPRRKRTFIGVHVTKTFNCNEQCKIILTKANQTLGILSRAKTGEEFFILPVSEASLSIVRQYGGQVVLS